MVSIGYYENDGQVYVFAVSGGIATRAYQATEGLMKALVEAECLEAAVEILIDGNHGLVEQEPLSGTRAAECLRALKSKCQDLERVDAPKTEKSNRLLQSSLFRDQIVVWPRNPILPVGRICSDERQIAEFNEHVLDFATKIAATFEAEVRSLYQAGNSHGMRA